MFNYEPVPSYLKQRILDQVITVAMASQGPVRIGAILMNKKTIVAAACNNYTKSDAFQSRASRRASIAYNRPDLSKRIFGHAETLALKKIRNNDADTIVVCRLAGKHNSKKLRLARPCKICSYLIQNFYPSIRHIHYSSEQGFLYEQWNLL